MGKIEIYEQHINIYEQHMSHHTKQRATKLGPKMKSPQFFEYQAKYAYFDITYFSQMSGSQGNNRKKFGPHSLGSNKKKLMK